MGRQASCAGSQACSVCDTKVQDHSWLMFRASGDFGARAQGVVTKVDMWAFQKGEWVSFVISALISLYMQLLKQS